MQVNTNILTRNKYVQYRRNLRDFGGKKLTLKVGHALYMVQQYVKNVIYVLYEKKTGLVNINSR